MTRSPEAADVRRDLSESRVLGSMLVGLALTAAFYLLFVYVLFRGTYFSAAFSERGLIPYVTTFLCGTGISLLAFGYLRIRREEATFSALRGVLEQRSPIDREAAGLALEEVRKLREARGGHIVANRFLRALHAVREGIKTKSDLSEALRNLADIDISILQATHLPVRYIVWLIPVLGFTGTVLGISSAISGFTVLMEGATDLAATKGALGSVALNLGVAFETTLLALIKTAVLMYAFSMLQKRERSFFINVDEYCADDLLERVVPLPRPREDKSETALLTDAIEGLTERLSTWDPAFVETLDAFFARVERWGGEVESKLYQRLGDGDRKLAARLGEFSDYCQSLSTTTDQAVERGVLAAATVSESADRFAEAVARIDALQSELSENVNALTRLEEFQRCLDALRESTERLPAAVEAMERPRRITLVESRDGDD